MDHQRRTFEVLEHLPYHLCQDHLQSDKTLAVESAHLIYTTSCCFWSKGVNGQHPYGPLTLLDCLLVSHGTSANAKATAIWLTGEDKALPLHKEKVAGRSDIRSTGHWNQGCMV